jgi:putative adhesin
MKMKQAVRYSILVVALFVAACMTAPQIHAQRRGFEGMFDRTLNVSGPVDLDVSTGSGRIDVRQGSTGRVQIHGVIRISTDWWRRSDRDAEDIVRQLESDPPIEQTGNMIRIGRMRSRDFDNVSVSYQIDVPAQTALRSQSGSGSVNVTGLQGAIIASTGSGGITLTDLRGNVRANTGSGTIHADGIAGGFNAATGSGGVTLSQTGNGDVDISTGSGTVRANGIRGALRIHSGSGGITAEGEQTGRWDLDTSSGSITIRLPENAGFDLNAHSGSGGVYVDHPITVQGRIDKRRNDVSGRVRGGGHALDVRTGSGSIRIE